MQTQSYSDPYAEFIDRKRVAVPAAGFNTNPYYVNRKLFPFQKAIVAWACARGRAAVFAECGLGKTPIQLAWAAHVASFTGRPVLILAPLAVSLQTKREGEKFDVPVNICRSQDDVQPGVNITNYEMLEHFDPATFGGVVLDESSILKSYMGATKQRLIAAFSATPYRLACTATPAPNDHMEIGNHAEFLGVLPSNDMLARWFVRDTMAMGEYRLKGHAEKDFWEWVASWAVSLRLPSDIGFKDDGFILPELKLTELVVPVDWTVDRGDRLFREAIMNATTMHKEMRLTSDARAQAVADLVNPSAETWVVWANTNYEADALTARIPDAVEVRGSETTGAKERKLADFLDGKTRVLVSKSSIFGFGLNLQFCHNTAFVGLSWSFESFYQAVRRVYRFGQTQPVNAYVVRAETEGAIIDTVRRKMADHDRLMASMGASRNKMLLTTDRQRSDYAPAAEIVIPDWLRSVA
jgi:hypothetical protein